MEKNFFESLKDQYGEELANKIIEGQKIKRKVTFRVNTIKANNEKIEKALNENNICFKKVAWYDNAYIVENAIERDLQELDIYKNGEIYLQSLSSMIPPLVLNAETGIDILDMTASPGGKTTQICALTNNLSNITACEVNKIRFERLRYNIEKQGATSCFVMQKDARYIDDFFKFDKILLDAPCSGSGTESFKEEIIEKCVKTQEALLDKALKILKAGGEMVYSTCSVLEKENENVVEKFIKQGRCEIVPIDTLSMFNSSLNYSSDILSQHNDTSISIQNTHTINILESNNGIVNENDVDKNILQSNNADYNKLPLLPTKLEGTLVVAPNNFYEGFFIVKLKKIK